MNPEWITTIVQSVRRGKNANQKMPFYKHGKMIYLRKISIKRLIIDSFLISLGVLSAGFGLQGFLVPNQFYDGGATGVALILKSYTIFDLSILLVLINIPFIVLGWRTINLQFALKTAFAIFALAICVAFFPYSVITKDKILIAMFGGFFLGAGIGLAVRGGAVIDGTEVLALYLSKKLSITVGDVILIINIIIFSFVAFIINLETAFYAILTYFAASKTVDFFIEGIEEYTGVTIVSVKYEAIRKMIIEKLGRGVTIYKGEKGFGKKGENPYEIFIIYTVITRLEVNKLTAEVEKIDPYAFLVMNAIKDTRGGMVKKRRYKEMK